MLMTEEEKTAYAKNIATMSDEQLINEVHDQVPALHILAR
jgi:hypothetical protein